MVREASATPRRWAYASSISPWSPGGAGPRPWHERPNERGVATTMHASTATRRSATRVNVVLQPALREKRSRRAASVVGALCVVSAGGCGSDASVEPAPPEVSVAQVISQRITDWDEYTGRFQAVDSVEVRPRASGYIDEVLFREGQLVKEGDVLFLIDPRPYQADYDRARAGLDAGPLAVGACETRGGTRAEAHGLRRGVARRTRRTR